ncbi:hypothetical protein CCS38_11025 [Streptomyces purpurogeneiscleroticus]|nr:hypothetical protein [Streptomyces purpurogeneiscleroticus]
MIDTRLIQTAVIGNCDSDQPVILPEEPHNLDQFRLRFGTDRFWCGTLLGGCGEQLMTKRYEDKVCHFAHFPDPEGARDCHRTAKGVESADHLFIKRDVAAWLAGQGHAAQADLRSLGHGPGDAVDFWLRATEQLLRFELRSEDYRTWRRAADSLAAKAGHIEWVFGSDSPLVDDMMARQGYALRVRCETSGTDRRVLIGVATRQGPVVWAPLDECRMTPHGLVPPALEGLGAEGTVRPGGSRNDPLPASLALRGTEITFAVDGSATPPVGSPLTAPGRYLITAYVKPAGSRIVQGYISLPDDSPAPTEDYVYQLSGVARILINDGSTTGEARWAIRADGLTQLNGLDAEHTGLWRPDVSLGRPLKTAIALSAGDTKPQSVPRKCSKTAARIREALLETAAARTTTTWEELSRKIGLDVSNLPNARRRDLLVEVDSPATPEKPLLSVLIRDRAGEPLTYLTTVLAILGRRTPGSGSAMWRWCNREARRTYAAHSPATSAAPAARSTEARVPSDTDDPAPVPGTASLARLRALRELTDEAKRVLSRATGRRAARLEEALVKAEAAVRAFEDASSRGRIRNIDGGVLLELERLIGYPVKAERPTASRGKQKAERAAPSLPRPTRQPEPVPPRAREQRSALTNEVVVDRMRPVLEELTLAGDTIDTLMLRGKMAHMRILRSQHKGALPGDLQTMFDVCSDRLAQRQRAGYAAVTETPTAPPVSTPSQRPVPAAMAVAPAAESATADQPRLPADELTKIARALRDVLENVARQQSTITWSGIRQRMERQLPHLHPDDQGEVLVMVDRDTPAGEPLLSALITVGDRHVHPLYRHVGHSLGRQLPCPENGLESQWQMDVLRLHSLWRHR